MDELIERRKNRILTDADVEAIAEALRLHHAEGLSEDEHTEHHRCFKRWLDAQEKKQARWEAMKTQVGGWAQMGMKPSTPFNEWVALMKSVRSIYLDAVSSLVLLALGFKDRNK